MEISKRISRPTWFHEYILLFFPNNFLTVTYLILNESLIRWTKIEKIQCISINRNYKRFCNILDIKYLRNQ